MQSQLEPALLSVRQTSEYLSTCEETLRYWLKTGRFQPIRIGKRVYFLKSEIDEFIQKQLDS